MTRADRPALSIVVPTLNESGNLRTCLSSIDYQGKLEVILCDGGSSDETLEIASEFPVVIVTSKAGRAAQMNAGARCARGDILLFLHADTALPKKAYEDIIESFLEGISMGCFERRFNSSSRLLALTSRWAGWRARKTFLVYGDQAIFIKRSLFKTLGGYRDMRRFEDLDLAVRAKPHGRWRVISGPIESDARRFGSNPLPIIIRDIVLTLAWLMGIIEQ